MKLILDTFTQALPAMGYVTLLITIVVYVFAVVGMSLFGKIELQGCLTEEANFQNVPRAMLTLVGVATGDRFTCLIHSCMVQERGKSYAVANACSEEAGTCGEPMW